MNAVTVALPEAQWERLCALAREAGVSPEEFARAAVQERLERPRQEFTPAARHVLEKNAELYRRLA